MFQITNEVLTVEIISKGAELQSIFNRQTGLEYMWTAGEAWPKKSPVLFPIVGELRNKQYQYKGNIYHLGRHGFARDMEFAVTEQSESAITFSIHDNEETRKVYPFHFSFSVRYSVYKNNLQVAYTVKNEGKELMYFSLGAHPAFKVPLVEGTSFEDYFLSFDKKENSNRWLLSNDGLIENKSTELLVETQKLPLKKSLFYEDALVLKDLKSTNISLLSDKTSNGLSMSFEGFPYMGIWSKKDADFVCIEPWCGIADNVNATGELAEKEGIHSLAAKEIFTRSWSLQLF